MRQVLLKITNLILAVLILNQSLTGFFRKIIGRDLFEIFHEKIAIVLVVFALLYISLNFSGIKNSYSRKEIEKSFSLIILSAY